MATKYLNPTFGNSINQRFRAKRFAFFLSLLEKLNQQQTISVLDIGGTESYWERMNFTGHENIHITLLNLEATTVKYKNFTSVAGDACNLHQYADKQFDIVFSNSVIEHLFTFQNQQKMAAEARRVGKNYYVQTPNYYFPLEPHWLFPFFQFLPFSMRVFLTNNFTLGHHPKARNKEAAVKRVEEVKLLTVKQMKTLFPDGELYREKFFGLTKSITMYRF